MTHLRFVPLAAHELAGRSESRRSGGSEIASDRRDRVFWRGWNTPNRRENTMALKGIPAQWETATKIAVIRDALQSHPHTGTDCRECKRAARSMYDRVGIEPLVFKSKVDGRMVELPKGKERWARFMNLIREVHAYIAAGDFTSEALPPVVSEPVIVSEPVKPVKTSLSADAEYLLSELRRLRDFANEREIDHVSYRPVKDGAAMLKAGL